MVESKYFSISSMFKKIGHILNPVIVYKYNIIIWSQMFFFVKQFFYFFM